MTSTTLPPALLLKVPKASGGAALGVLLERGAPTQFVQRKVGEKSSRFLFVEDSDGVEAARLEWGETASDQGGADAHQYRQTLAAARATLLQDKVLRENVLFVSDPLCWPPPVFWRDIVLLRCETLGCADRIAGNALKDAFLFHVAEVEGSGRFPLIEEPLEDRTGVVFQTGYAGAGSGSAPSSASLRKAVEMKPMRSIQTSLCVDFTGVKNSYDLFDVRRLQLHQTILGTFKKKFGIAWHDLLRWNYRFHVRELSRLFDEGGLKDLTHVADAAANVLYTVGHFIHHERPMMSQQAMMEALEKHNSDRLRLCNGVYVTRVRFDKTYVIQKNVTAAKRAGELTDAAIEAATGGGNPFSALTTSEVETFERQFGVKSLYGSAEAGLVKVLVWNEPEEAESYDDKLKTQETMPIGPSNLESRMQMMERRTLTSNANAPEEKLGSTTRPLDIENDKLMAEAHFDAKACFPKSRLSLHPERRRVQLSSSTCATEFFATNIVVGAQSTSAAEPLFVAGEDFFILHGPRVQNQEYNLAEIAALLHQEFESIAKSTRPAILKSLRQLALQNAEFRRVNTRHFPDGKVEEILLERFAQSEGMLMFRDLMKDPSMLGVPEPQVKRLLKKIGYYNKRKHCWIKA